MTAVRPRMMIRTSTLFTRAMLFALPVGLGWLGGTALRSRSAVGSIPIPQLADLDTEGAGMSFGPARDVRAGDVGGIDVARGNPDVPVLRIFGDYECASCQRLEQTAGDSLRSLARSGLLRLIYHHAPLRAHWRGPMAAEVAYCADADGRGAPVHQALYRSVFSWAADGADPLASMIVVARQAGANGDSIAECIAADRMTTRVMRDRDVAAVLQVVAVPTVFLDHSRLEFNSYAALLDHVARTVRMRREASAAS